MMMLKKNQNSYKIDREKLKISKHIKLGIDGSVIYYLNTYKDDRGTLSVCEVPEIIPFEVKRCFFVYKVPPFQDRANHAHKDCKEFLICVQGSCNIRIDDSKSSSNIILNNPDTGLYLPEMTWISIYEFSYDAILLVFASSLYDETDYIRDYEDFLFQKLNV